MIPQLTELSYTESLDKLNLWSLEERQLRADLIEVYIIRLSSWIVNVCHTIPGFI